MKLDIFTEIQKRDCEANGGFAQLFDGVDRTSASGRRGGLRVLVGGGTPLHAGLQLQLVSRDGAHCDRNEYQRLRVGHAGVLVPFEINHPLRVAERGAMLDHISHGRFELGLARSGGREWETFAIDEQQTGVDLIEATHLISKAWTDVPFNWSGKRWSVADREVLPRPVQQPHPPLWHTCGSAGSFRRAGELGVGVLGTTMFAPLETMEAHGQGVS